MILKRLYELAEREKLLDDPAFVSMPIPFIINIGPDGKYLGIEQRRGTISIPGKKNAPAKVKPDKGKELSVPKPHGNTANRGFACFFADTLARVLPVCDEEKSKASRQTFWKQIEQAAQETNDPALAALRTFGQNAADDQILAKRIQSEVEAQKPGPGERCTFAWHSDGGANIVERIPVRDWYRKYFAAISSSLAEDAVQGFCQITGEYGPLPRSHSTKISRVPGGIASGVSLVSYDKTAFESYNLDGAVNACIGSRAADGYTRALNALAADKISGSIQTSLRVGNTLFLFWTREQADTSDVMQIDQPNPEQVALLIQSATKGREVLAMSSNDFYCLAMSGNAARAIVRDYIETPLPELKNHLGKWFYDLQMVDYFTGEVTAIFPLWALAKATVRDSDDLAPSLPSTLLMSAIKGNAIPGHVLAACLRRIRAESGSQQFSAARMALIKMNINRFMKERNQGEIEMTATLDETRPDPPYLCGRMLAVLERLQYLALGEVGATIVDRFFGAASIAPRTVFPRLIKSSEHHLAKAGERYPGSDVRIKELLGVLMLQMAGIDTRTISAEQLYQMLDGMRKNDIEFPAMLNIEEQGRFAIGFYHQRAAYRQASQERKAAEKHN